MTLIADRKPMSADRTIHICPLLDDSALYLERMFEDDSLAMRWMLCYAPRGRPADDDVAYMRAVAFCPGCGLDVSVDLCARSAGRPAMNELLREGAACGETGTHRASADRKDRGREVETRRGGGRERRAEHHAIPLPPPAGTFALLSSVDIPPCL